MKIAVIGTGISGMLAAYMLCRDHDLTVFEANDYIGGHTNTVNVDQDGQSYAVDTGISKAWWAKPFLKLIKHYTMDPSKPLAARDLIKLVASGEPVVIFPEGRITVSGSLMKVYDGTAMIADKADAVVVPVRIEGAQRSRLSYLKNGEIKRSWFPKVTISILPPVKLSVDPSLKGKTRRNAAGSNP